MVMKFAIDIFRLCCGMSCFEIVSFRRFCAFVFFFSVLFFPFSSFATDTCYSVVVLDFVQGGGSCSQDPPVNPPSLPSNSACSVIGELVSYGNCTAVYRYCCDMTAVNQYENDIRMSYVVTGIGFGQEPTAAQTTFDQFMTEQAPGGCADNYSPAGFLAGFAYDTSMNLNGQSSDIGLSAWKRTLCAKAGQGEVIPLSSLSGGSGSGSGSYTDFLNALNNSDALAAIYDVRALLSAGDGSPLLSTTNDWLSQILAKPVGAGGGGLSLSDTTLAVKSGILEALGEPIGDMVIVQREPVVQQAYKNSSLPLSDTINFQERFTTFFNDMKSTPLFTNFGLAELGNVGGGQSVMAINFGSYGTVNFDLNNYSGVFGAIKGVVLLLGSYLAVRAVTMKR